MNGPARVLAAGIPSASRLSEAEAARFSELVRQASGLEVPVARRLDLDQAVAQTRLRLGAADNEALFHILAAEAGRPALEALIEALTIGETHFFRNRPQFDVLTTRILPELIAAGRATRRLRLWSAGCATGEEPYSLAILLEILLPELDEWDVQILATDINRQALAKAHRGLYGAWSFREVPPDIHKTFFIPQGGLWEVAPRVRRRVTFAHLNFVKDSYPSLLTNTAAMDLILFRNVLIYFREATTRMVVGRLQRALVEGGWLVVGHADTAPGAFDQFVVHNFPGTVIYQKKVGGALRAAPPPKPPAPQPPERRAAPPALEPRLAAKTASAPPAAGPYQAALDLWKRGQPDEALRRLEALAADPHEALAAYHAAKIEADRQRLPEAERQIELALQRQPLLAPVHYLHGLILQATGRPEEAVAALRRCVYADDQLVVGHFALANLLARLGQAARARKALDNVERLLAGRPRDELLSEGDGLTVGRLLELAAVQKEIE